MNVAKRHFLVAMLGWSMSSARNSSACLEKPVRPENGRPARKVVLHERVRGSMFLKSFADELNPFSKHVTFTK